VCAGGRGTLKTRKKQKETATKTRQYSYDVWGGPNDYVKQFYIFTKSMRVVRFSQQCSWFRSSGIWGCIIEQSDPDVSRKSGVLIFKVRSFATCWRNAGEPRKIQRKRQNHHGMAHTLLPLLMMEDTNITNARSITYLHKAECSYLCCGRLFQCPSDMICILNSNSVVKVLNHCNLLTFSYIQGGWEVSRH